MTASARRAVVVGAGVLGTATARELAMRGWAVTLVEAFSPGHVRASSGGESRLIRCAHGSDRFYTDWAVDALRRWGELEAETGHDVLVRCGVAWFARSEEGWEAASAVVLEEADVPVRRLDPTEATALFPALRTDDLAFVLHEPDAGVLRARRAVRALVDSATAHGAVVRAGSAVPAGGRVRLYGEVLDADAVVWACGPWLPGLFPDVPGVRELRVTKQDVTFFGVPPAWRTPPVPAWVDYDGAAYGLGDLDGRGLKCATDIEGPAFDPERHDRTVGPDGEQRARRYLAHRFPSLASAPLIGARVCTYTLTVDTHFLLARHPQHHGVWLVGGGSGHGFKHAPVVGAHVADLCEARREPEPRFGLAPRRPAASMRTAGGSPPER